MECRFLAEHGRTDLAKKLRYAAKVDGDRTCYDVLSFDLGGNEKYIEVKTTNGPKETTFVLTTNELKVCA